MSTPAPLTNDQRARVERHVDRVRKIASGVHRLLPHVELDELVSLGHEGLIEAARRYDPESGVTFASFAHYRIRGAMIDGARRHQRAGRQHARAVKALESSQAVLEQASKDHARADLESLRSRVAAVRKLVERTSVAALMSQSAAVEPDQVATEPEAERRLVGDELRQRLSRSVAGLEPQEQLLVQAIYVEERSMQAVAEELGINKSTVSRRHGRVLDKLAEALREHSGPGD